MSILNWELNWFKKNKKNSWRKVLLGLLLHSLSHFVSQLQEIALSPGCFHLVSLEEAAIHLDTIIWNVFNTFPAAPHVFSLLQCHWCWSWFIFAAVWGAAWSNLCAFQVQIRFRVFCRTAWTSQLLPEIQTTLTWPTLHLQCCPCQLFSVSAGVSSHDCQWIPPVQIVF